MEHMRCGTGKFHKLPAMLLNFEARQQTKNYEDMTDEGMFNCNIHISIINHHISNILGTFKCYLRHFTFSSPPLSTGICIS